MTAYIYTRSFVIDKTRGLISDSEGVIAPKPLLRRNRKSSISRIPVIMENAKRRVSAVFCVCALHTADNRGSRHKM